jgi:hypothetical protein
MFYGGVFFSMMTPPSAAMSWEELYFLRIEYSVADIFKKIKAEKSLST